MTGRLGQRARHNPALGLASLLLLALGLVLAACGDDGTTADRGNGDDGGNGTTDNPEDVAVIDGSEADVNVIDNTFDAQNIQVQVGTTVIWTNNGRQDHDIIAVDESAGFGVDPDDFAPDSVYEYTFGQPGTYRYYCSLHGTEDAGMVGTVIVQDE